MSTLHLDVNTLIYLGTTLIMGVGFIWKMKTDQTSTASVIKTELGHMKEIQEQNREDFNNSLVSIKEDFYNSMESVKDDFKQKLDESSKVSKELINSELKHVVNIMEINHKNLTEDINRLEKKSDESNHVRERVSILESGMNEMKFRIDNYFNNQKGIMEE